MEFETRYVDVCPSPETLPGTVQSWQRFGAYLSVLSYADRTVYKRRGALGRDAEECLEAWRWLGFKGSPSSPSSFFRGAFLSELGERERLAVRGTNRRLARYQRGAWCETFERGPIPGPLVEYDVNRAFLSAALTRPIPFSYTRYPGRIAPRARLVLMTYSRPHRLAVPNRLAGGAGKTVLVTPEEIDRFGLSGGIVESYAARRTSKHIVGECIDMLARAGLPPRIQKRVESSFWGQFAATRGLVQATHREGVKTSERWMDPDPRISHVGYSAEIVEGVVAKVSDAVYAPGRTVLVHVDNVVTDAELATGEDVGAWRVARELPRGVYVQASGLWHDDQEAWRYDRREWIKHAGIAEVRETLKAPAGPSPEDGSALSLWPEA